MTCTTSLLEIPRFVVPLLTIISYIYFTLFSDSNALFFIGKVFSYVISFLKTLYKTLNTVCLLNGSKPNSKQASSHCPLKYGYRLFTKDFSSLGQFYSVHQQFLCFFAVGISSATLTVTMSCGADNSAPDSMGINSQYLTTNFYWTITFLNFIRSSCLDFSCCGLMNFSFFPLLLMKYY